MVIGGGPIGVELGQAFAHLGSQVTILDTGKKFLPKESPEVATILQKQLEKEGVQLIFEATPISFPKNNQLKIKHQGKEKLLEFDEVLISIGRELNIDNLDLEKSKNKV